HRPAPPAQNRLCLRRRWNCRTPGAPIRALWYSEVRSVSSCGCFSAGCNQTRSRPFSRFDVHRLELERLKKSRRELTRLKAGVVENLLMKRDRRLNAFDHELIERADHLSYGELARASSHDQLGDHRVVVLRDSVSRVRVRIHANAGSSRRMERRDDAG